MSAPAVQGPSLVFRCAFCDSPLRDSHRICPRCGLHIDEGQLQLFRANILLGETGAWRKSGEVPEFIVERLMEKYKQEHRTAMSSLIARSPKFRADAVPMAAIEVAPVIEEAKPLPLPVVEEKPVEAPKGWVTVKIDPVPAAPAPVPPPFFAQPPPSPAPAPAVPVAPESKEPVVVAPPVIAPAPKPPVESIPLAVAVAAATGPAVESASPERIPPSAPVEVVSIDAGGKPHFAAPRVAKARPETPKEDLLFGVLSEQHLNILAGAGIFAVFVAIVLLVYKSWEGYTPLRKVGMVAAGALVSMGLGALLRTKTVLKTTGGALFVIGTLSVPVVFAAAANYGLLAVSGSVFGLTGAVTSAALYTWLGRRKGLEFYRWLALVSIVGGHGFLLDLCGVKNGDLAPGYGILGAVLAAWAVKSKRFELHAVAATVLCGSMVASVPFVIDHALSAKIGLAGAVAMCGGFALLSALNPKWTHGAWIAAGGAAAAACMSFTPCPWAAWPASLAAVGAAALFVALKKHPRTEALLPGGLTLLVVAGALAVGGYAGHEKVAAAWGLLWFAALATPAIAVTAWKRDDEAWATAALVAPGAIFFAVRQILDLPMGWLPLGLGAYAAGLYAFGRRTNVFARAATPVAAIAHLVAFLVACNPGAVTRELEVLGRIPTYWGDKAWRVALAMALPGLSLLFTRVKRDPRWLYAAEPSLLVSVVFAAHAIGVGGQWVPTILGGAALAGLAAAWKLDPKYRGPVSQIGAFAALPAAIAGIVLWAQPAGAAGLAVSGALIATFGALSGVEVCAAAGAALASAAWCSTAHILWKSDPVMAKAMGGLGFLAFAAMTPLFRDAKTRVGVQGGAFLVSVLTIAFLVSNPDTHEAAGAGKLALEVFLVGAAAIALGFRRGDDTQEPALWSGVGAFLATMGGAYLGIRLQVRPEHWAAASALIPAGFMAAGSFRATKPQGLPWAAVGAAGCLVFAAVSGIHGAPAIAAATFIASVPTMLLAFRGPQREVASGAAVALLSTCAACLAVNHVNATWFAAVATLVPAAFTVAGSFRIGKPQGLPWTILGAAGCVVFCLLSVSEGNFNAISAATLVASVPAMILAFRGPQQEAASGAAVLLLGVCAACFARTHVDPKWFAVACTVVPAAFTIAGALRMRHPQGMPWATVGAAGVALAVAASLDGGYASVAAATALAAVPAMLLTFTGPARPYAAGAGAALLSVSAGCLAAALRVSDPWLAPACALVPCAFMFAGAQQKARPQGLPWIGAGVAGLVTALILSAAASSLSFAIVASIAAVPAFAVSCTGPQREWAAGLFAVLASAAGAAFAFNVHGLSEAWVAVACAAVPAALVALGAYAHYLPQGRPWAAVGGFGVFLALAYSFALGQPTELAVACLVAAAAAGSAVRYSPATLSGAAALLFNASVAAFLVAAKMPSEVAAPLLVVLAALEALAASLAGAKAAAHAVFAAAAALAFGGVCYAFAGPHGEQLNLVPGMIALGIAAAASGIAATIRRQPYLWAVTGCVAVAEFYLALAHFQVHTLEAYTFLPAAVLLAWSHFAARRTAVVIPDTPQGPVVEATLSQWARRLAATVHEQLGTVRLLAIAAALGPSVLLALPTEERAHLPYALLGSVAVLVGAVLARRRKEAIAGIGTLAGLIGLKGVEWMVQKELSFAWWILVVGSALIAFVAVFEIRRSWYLKGKGEAVRKVVEAYLAKWR